MHFPPPLSPILGSLPPFSITDWKGRNISSKENWADNFFQDNLFISPSPGEWNHYNLTLPPPLPFSRPHTQLSWRPNLFSPHTYDNNSIPTIKIQELGNRCVLPSRDHLIAFSTFSASFLIKQSQRRNLDSLNDLQDSLNNGSDWLNNHIKKKVVKSGATHLTTPLLNKGNSSSCCVCKVRTSGISGFKSILYFLQKAYVRVSPPGSEKWATLGAPRDVSFCIRDKWHLLNKHPKRAAAGSL